MAYRASPSAGGMNPLAASAASRSSAGIPIRPSESTAKNTALAQRQLVVPACLGAR